MIEPDVEILPPTSKLPATSKSVKVSVPCTLSATTNEPNEPVDVIEPLTFAASTTAELLINVFSALPNVTKPVADVIEF